MSQVVKTISQYWERIQGTLFSWLEEELDPLTEMQKRLVTILDLVEIEVFLPDLRGCEGRPQKTRSAIARAYIAKMFYNIDRTTILIERLKTDKTFRRICGWETLGELPSESTFSRAFADFAKTNLPQRAHEALIKNNLGDVIFLHGSKDSTAVEAREKPVSKRKKENKLACADTGASNELTNEAEVEASPLIKEEKNETKKEDATRKSSEKKPSPHCKANKKKKKKGRPKKGEERSLPELSRIEKQKTMSLEEMLNDLPKACDKGGKKDSKGNTMFWNGYKLHLDTVDYDIPVSAIVTSASVHDSQVAIPIMNLSAGRIINLYDLMDSAYYVPAIIETSCMLGHVPLIDTNPRRDKELKSDLKSEAKARKTLNWAPAEEVRYNARSGAERSNSRLKDEFGACNVRVRGHAKVACHLLFGVLVLAADQILRIAT